MKMATPSSIALLGLKGSGKTTYLAALWHLLEAQELKTRLKVRSLQLDREYLNAIRSAWLAFEPVPRTSVKIDVRVDLLLEGESSHDLVDLSFPDMSGESYRLQWSLRRAKPEYANLAPSIGGVLLFIHPEVVGRAQRIAGETQIVSMSPGAVGVQVPSAKEWKADTAPTQVQLVDVLQSLVFLRRRSEPMRVAVMISAWDPKSTLSKLAPMYWLESQMPMLHQYLCSNSKMLPTSVFGISAQGGSYDSDRNILKKQRVASDRIQMRSLEGQDLGHDLTIPLDFVLGQDVAPLLDLEASEPAE